MNQPEHTTPEKCETGDWVEDRGQEVSQGMNQELIGEQFRGEIENLIGQLQSALAEAILGMDDRPALTLGADEALKALKTVRNECQRSGQHRWPKVLPLYHRWEHTRSDGGRPARNCI